MNRNRLDNALGITRRYFFEECGVGVGKIALGMLLGEGLRTNAFAASAEPDNPLAPKKPHFAPRAKRVIHLFMAGAPSQLDLFDYKPELARHEGKPLPPSVIMGQRYAFIRPDAAVLGPRFKFAKHGQCGASLSEMLPHLAERGRRHLHRQVDAHGPVQSCTGPDFLEHRLFAAGPAELGVLGVVRVGV